MFNENLRMIKLILDCQLACELVAELEQFLGGVRINVVQIEYVHLLFRYVIGQFTLPLQVLHEQLLNFSRATLLLEVGAVLNQMTEADDSVGVECVLRRLFQWLNGIG